MPRLADNAEFFLKSATPQADHSILCEFVCPQPGEGVDGGPFPITISPEEFALYPEIVNGEDGAISIMEGAKPGALEAVYRAILEPKVIALAASMRPPVDVAASIEQLLNTYEPVVEVEASRDAKKVVVDEETKQATEHDVVIPAVTTGGSYTGKAFVG
jgi:copper chaperone CopZ